MNLFKNKWFNLFRIARVIFYLIFFLSFIIIDTSFFIKNNSICMSANVLHVLCPTCGVTRAFSCFMHLDFKAAFSYNPIFTVAFGPIFIFLFLEDLVNIVIHFFKKINRFSIMEYIVFRYL